MTKKHPESEILALMPVSPALAGDIAKPFGLDRRNMKARLDKLVADGKVARISQMRRIAGPGSSSRMTRVDLYSAKPE